MWSVARFGGDGRPLFVKEILPGGGIETTKKAQLAMTLFSLEEATKLADKLGNDWYAVEWRTVK